MADPQSPGKPPPLVSGFTNIGHELDPTAPLWKTYCDEVLNLDKTVYFEELHKTVDTLLIFAGLFSAVVTSFVIASFPLLTPGNQTDAVVNAVHALALAINSSITLATPPEPVTTSSIWVNGLWLTSLFIALSVALVAILAKQWFGEYNHSVAESRAPSAHLGPSNSASAHSPAHLASMSLVAASIVWAPPSPRPPHLDAIPLTASLAWARRRRVLFSAFADWHITVLITLVLPFLLHVALFLFLTGLSLFVWTLNKRIALCMTVLTLLLSGLYVIATVLPIFRAECPTATPLIRRARGRAREVPTWIAIKAVKLWRAILPIALRAFGPSSITWRDVNHILDNLRRRQEHIRASRWHGDERTTDDELKLDTLRWLLVSGSESAITAAFQALGALPAESPIINDIRNITAEMHTPVVRLGTSQSPPTAVEIIRAVRSELVLGRGSWNLPLLGLDLSPSLIRTLLESQHPDARLLSAAMHLDGMLYGSSCSRHERSFSSLYDITDRLLRRDHSSDSGPSTARLLLDRRDIPVPAFACLSVLLAQSVHIHDSDKALIFRIFYRLRNNRCSAKNGPHTCDGLCVVVFMVSCLDLRDPASHRIVPIVLSHLLPCLMPESKNGSNSLVPYSLARNDDFLIAISSSDWRHSPLPARNSDVTVLSTLMSRFDCSYEPGRDAYMQTFEWFMSRGQYGTLRSPGLIAKVQNALTCDSDERPWMLQDLCSIVHRVKPNDPETLGSVPEDSLGEFLSSLISLCGDLLPYSHERSRDALFSLGLVPEIGACLGRLGDLAGFWDTYGKFFDMVNTALHSLDEHVENREEYLLHLAQHCLELDRKWTRREEVGAHLDARRIEELLVQKGPCTKCTEGSVDKWPDEVLDVLRARTPTVEQSPQPGPSTLPQHDATSTLPAPSAPAMLLTTASPPDAASSSSITAIPNAIPVLRVGSTPTSILHAATGSGPVTSSAGSNPVLATLSISPGYAVLVSAADSTPAVDTPSGTTPRLDIVPSLAATATQHVTIAPTHIRAPEVSPSATSPAELDDIGPRVISQPGPASRSDVASTAHSPSDLTASSVGQGHDDRVTHPPRTVSSVADDAAAVAAVRLATSSAATGSSSVSSLDVPAAAIASSPCAVSIVMPSSDPLAAQSHAGTSDDTAGHDVAPGSSTG